MQNDHPLDIDEHVFYFESRASILARVNEWLPQKQPTCLVHPHGFYVILLQNNSFEEWRLHIWPSGARNITGMPALIHTHNCHVESRVLTGCLVNKTYKVEPVAIGGNPLYQVIYRGDRYAKKTENLLVHCGARVSCAENETTVVHAGCVYHVARNAWHEAIVQSDTTTVTLAKMYNRNDDPVFLMGRDGYPHEIEFSRTEYSIVDVGYILQSIR